MMIGPGLIEQVAGDVLRTFQANWAYLLLSVVAASALQVFVGTDRLATWLRARTPLAVVGAVTLGALTPFCSCGTTAIVLGALASAVPWAPIVAFMVSSPLTSPGEYLLSIGLFGAGFATVYFTAAFALGIGAGWVTHHVERAGWLQGQHRVNTPQPCTDECAATGVTQEAVACCVPATTPVGVESSGRATLELDAASTGCESACVDASISSTAAADVTSVPASSRQFAAAVWTNGKRLAVLFFGFTALGYLLIRMIPTELLTGLLGDDSPVAVPLAALLGIPVYLNSDGSLPLVASLMDGGMGSGAAIAFLITGAGTSVGAVSGMLLIARWRVVALVVLCLFMGAVMTGYLAPLFV